MGILFTTHMGFLFTITMGILFTIVLGIQFTISKKKQYLPYYGRESSLNLKGECRKIILVLVFL